ncbi:hypothetical protein, partial [Stenotrophomonas indicatrix]|uniref:hypothetical protein n=1 Tax=Stenotrophomonas indicatrix TaxID=2045451 RepID=UPI001AA0E115
AEVAPADKRKQPAVIGFADPATRFQWHAMVCTSPPLLPVVEQVRSVMSYASRLFWHARDCPEMPALQGVSRGAQRAGQLDASCSASAAQRPHRPPARVDRDNTADRARHRGRAWLNLFSQLCRTRRLVGLVADAALPSPRVLPATMARCDNVSHPDPGLSCA